MKKYFLYFLLLTPLLLSAAPVFQPRDFEKRTASGIMVRYRAGTRHLSGGIEFLQGLDRELTRIFLAPPGAGACRIIVDRSRSPREIACRVLPGCHEICIGEAFVQFAGDPQYRGELAARILAARFGLAESGNPLPGWIVCGLEGIRQNNLSTGMVLRNMRYYPVLRGLIGAGIYPDCRAFMQMEDVFISESIQPAMLEFGRFLLESFAGISSPQNRALGDYTADVLKKRHPESESFRTYLQPAIRRVMGGAGKDTEFFRLAAERAAFNPRAPRPAEALLIRLPEVLRYSVPSPGPGKKLAGTAGNLPALFAARNPQRFQAQKQLLFQLQMFQRELPLETQAAGGALLQSIRNVRGEDPAAETAQIKRTLQQLREALKKQALMEQYLQAMEEKHISPLRLFRADLSVICRDDEFLSGEERDFFNRIETQYLEN